GSSLEDVRANDLENGTYSNVYIFENSENSFVGDFEGEFEGNLFGNYDNAAVEIVVNGNRALRIEPSTWPNIIAGYSGNSVNEGVVGATISGGGGGLMTNANSVTSDFGTVCGGSQNTAGNNHTTVGGGLLNQASGSYATVPGGADNQAAGQYSLSAGRRAKIDAAHNGTFLWADGTDADFNSTNSDQFRIRATNGVDVQAGGLVVGSPTGGHLGAGTINAEAIYDDNTIISDYVFDRYFDGKVKEEDEALHGHYQMLSLEEMIAFMKKIRHLPTIIGREEWKKKGKSSLGELVNQLWETVETQSIYIMELNERIDSMERIMQKLELLTAQNNKATEDNLSALNPKN
ncbi:hypothetical protein ACFLSX_04855, partial [Calditrichota bacterium]